MPRTSIPLLATLALVAALTPAFADPALSPPAGAREICPDTPLKITLTAPVTAGTGKIEVCDASDNSVAATIDLAQPTRTQTIGGIDNYIVRPLLLTPTEASFALPPHALAYNKTYYVKVPPTALTGLDRQSLNLADDKSVWRFTTKAAPPAADAPRLVVDAHNTADFATVQGAIDFIPQGNKTPRQIFITAGTYNEILCLLDKSNITFLGQQRDKTILSYANAERFNTNAGGNPFGPGMPAPGMADPKTGAVYRRGVFLIHRASDITLANLTIHNTTPKGGGQAETIIFNGSPDAGHFLITNVSLYSYQDTLQFNGQIYIANSYIEGDTDFMWGTGPAYFENCHARALTNGAYFTTVRNPTTNRGFCYKDCTFDGAPGVTTTSLARAEGNRFPTSEDVLLNVEMTAAISPAAWTAPTGGIASVHYWEYNSHTPDGKPVDDSRRQAASKRLTDPADKETIANYSNPTWFLNAGGITPAPSTAPKWTPTLAPLIARSPANATTKLGSSIEFQVDAVAIPAPSYQWQKNGTDLPGQTNPSLKFDSLNPTDAATYSVTVTNTAGKATSTPAHLTLTP